MTMPVVAIDRTKGSRKGCACSNELAQRVRNFWHARLYSRASDPVVALLEIALEQVEREQQQGEPKR